MGNRKIWGHSSRILGRIFYVTATVLAGVGVSHGASAYIRVNQVGYISSASKRAYLMATASESGATFAVKNSSGTTVYSASVGASVGKWGTFTVYGLDFDSLSTVGTYTISVASPIDASSTTTWDTEQSNWLRRLSHHSWVVCWCPATTTSRLGRATR